MVYEENFNDEKDLAEIVFRRYGGVGRGGARRGGIGYGGFSMAALELEGMFMEVLVVEGIRRSRNALQLCWWGRRLFRTRCLCTPCSL
jgi:hypothetical protein